MPILLETFSAGLSTGRVAVPADGARINALPGLRHVLTASNPDLADRGVVVLRMGDDLAVSDPAGNNLLILEGFFSRCAPADACSFSMMTADGRVLVSIVPSTLPSAALTDGSFLLYGAPPSSGRADAATDWGGGKVGLTALAALAAVGALAGGGGASSTSDTTPPDAPRISTASVTNRSQPVFAGSAEPGSTITLTVFSEGASTWQTRTTAEGSWRIDTGQEMPAVGSPVILREGIAVDYSVVATDASGNRSPLTSSRITLDTASVATPVILDLPENSGGGINALEAIDGTELIVSIAGVSRSLGDYLLIESGGVILASHRLSASEVDSGRASVIVSAESLALLEDGSSEWVARLVDSRGVAGSPSSPFVVRIDTLAPSNSVRSIDMIDDVAPGRGPIPDGGTTDDPTPTLVITLETVLEAGESLIVFRADGALPPRQAGTAAPDRTTVYRFTDEALQVGETYTYTASISDAAGNLLPLDFSRTLSLT